MTSAKLIVRCHEEYLIYSSLRHSEIKQEIGGTKPWKLVLAIYIGVDVCSQILGQFENFFLNFFFIVACYILIFR